MSILHVMSLNWDGGCYIMVSKPMVQTSILYEPRPVQILQIRCCQFKFVWIWGKMDKLERNPQIREKIQVGFSSQPLKRGLMEPICKFAELKSTWNGQILCFNGFRSVLQSSMNQRSISYLTSRSMTQIHFDKFKN